MTTPIIDPKIAQLERYLQQLTQQIADLTRRINYLERENSRRKSEMTQVASVLNNR